MDKWHVVRATKSGFRCACGWDTFNIPSNAEPLTLVAKHVVQHQFKVGKVS